MSIPYDLPLIVPDPAALSHVQKLCDLRHPYARSRDIDQLFALAMEEINTWHRNRSPFWNRLLEAESDVELPLIPASFFKRHEVLSIPREQIALRLTSSGTSGQKSQMFFDSWSIGVAQRMVAYIFDYYGWYAPDSPVDYLLFSYEPAPRLRVGTSFTNNYLCDFAPARRVTHALRHTGAGPATTAAGPAHEFDPFGALAAIERAASDSLPLRIFGFPSFLAATLQRMRDLGYPPVKLHPDSLVFLGGGWKNHAHEEIPKERLRAMASDLLSIPPDRIRDSFGSVEHCVPVVECVRHRLHLPVWSRATIHDFATLDPLGYGQRGFLHLISPYITSSPAHSVLMGDIATAHPAHECECGAATDWIVLHGRAGTSRNRSCAVAAAELLKGHV